MFPGRGPPMDKLAYGNGPGRFLSAALLYVLIAEWIRPLADMPHWTGLYAVEPILLALAGMLAADALRLPAFLGVPVKVFAAMTAVAVMFAHTTALDAGWWVRYADTLRHDAGRILDLDWERISGENRTLAFLLAWSVAASSLLAAALRRRIALWLAAVTAGFLVLLQAWPGLDTTAGVVRACAAGLALHGLSVLPSLERVYGAKFAAAGSADAAGDAGARAGDSGGRFSAAAGQGALDSEAAVGLARRLAAVAALAGLAVAGGLLMAEGERGERPDWEALSGRGPLAAWPSFAGWEQPAGQGVPQAATFPWSGSAGGVPELRFAARTGYGADDSLLGGSLQPDDTVLFIGVAGSHGVYWRGEAKSVYDGRGWHAHPGDSDIYGIGESLPNALLSEGTDERSGRSPVRADIFLTAAGRMAGLPLLSPGAILRVDRAEDAEGRELSGASVAVHPAEGRVALVPLSGGRGRSGAAAHYGVLAEPAIRGERLPPFPAVGGNSQTQREIEFLRPQADSPAGFSATSPGVSGSVLPVHLQLPETLPERVRELALEITRGHETVLAKAAAIEAYLREGYAYTLTPKEKGDSPDFADRFLFEQKEGYCDHFSTAMVVLLRAAGIPARWVKGFAPGESVGAAEAAAFLREPLAGALKEAADGRAAALVRASNAHSWVEAYIAGWGWVAFEPTPGFAAGADAGGQPRPLRIAAPLDAFPEQFSAGDKTMPTVREQITVTEAVHGTDAELSRRAAGSAGAWPKLKEALKAAAELISRHRAVMLTASFVAAAMVLAYPAAFFRRGGFISLRWRMFLYACGFGGPRADAVLLEKMLIRAVGGGTGRLSGLTLRERAEKAAREKPASPEKRIERTEQAARTDTQVSKRPGDPAAVRNGEGGDSSFRSRPGEDASGRDGGADSPLLKLLALYERAAFGPPGREMVPLAVIWRHWRDLVKKRREG